jgi:hypothetical protein
MRTILFSLLLSVFLLTAVCPLWASSSDEKPEYCILCGKLHWGGDHTVAYKGREIALCSAECAGEFEKHRKEGTLDPITAKIEPRAALFQEDSNSKARLSDVYFAVGFYVLLGLVCGGLASYVAVQKGLPGGKAFALGLAANVIGLVYVWTRPSREMPFTSAGLTKIPSTRDEQPCPNCERSNHPSARTCIACGSALEPGAPSEVRLAGLRPEP